MAYRNTTLFLLLPGAAEYPPGRHTLQKHNIRLDSGIDVKFPKNVTIPPNGVAKIDLGVRAICLRLLDPASANPDRILLEEGGVPPGAVLPIDPVEIPWAYYILPRSSISKTPLALANTVGLIDLGYRGSLIVAVRNLSDEAFTVEAGTALFQIVSADLAPPEYEVLTPDDPRAEKYFGAGATARGAGSFGSTGAGGAGDK
mgnify:CR=1 FL=1